MNVFSTSNGASNLGPWSVTQQTRGDIIEYLQRIAKDDLNLLLRFAQSSAYFLENGRHEHGKVFDLLKAIKAYLVVGGAFKIGREVLQGSTDVRNFPPGQLCWCVMKGCNMLMLALVYETYDLSLTPSPNPPSPDDVLVLVFTDNNSHTWELQAPWPVLEEEIVTPAAATRAEELFIPTQSGVIQSSRMSIGVWRIVR
jgi:hypothetical protein